MSSTIQAWQKNGVLIPYGRGYGHHMYLQYLFSRAHVIGSPKHRDMTTGKKRGGRRVLRYSLINMSQGLLTIYCHAVCLVF